MLSTDKLSDFLHLRHFNPKAERKAATPTPVFKNANDRYDCGMDGCEKDFGRPSEARRHQKSHTDPQLFVYLRHHLVFKTDIVISVNAHIPDAEKVFIG
jgi:hypothetical protein